MMFNPDISIKLQPEFISANKVTSKQKAETKIFSAKTIKNTNKELTIEHNNSAQPLTAEKQIIKNQTKQTQLDEIYAMKVLAQKKDSQTFLPQTLSYTRQDGIKLELTDTYEGNITNIQNDYSDYEFLPIKLIISDQNNQKHEINVSFESIYDRDIVDLRKMKEIVGKFLTNLPPEKLNEFIDKNIKNISFITEENEYIETYENDSYISSPSFVLPKRDYKTESNFTREDGCKIEIKDQNEISSTLTITTPDNEVLNFKIEGNDTDKLHQFQLPKFQKLLKEIPVEVLKDLSDEIDCIRFMDNQSDANGIYPLGSNIIALKLDYNTDTRAISFVHELGHALDNQNGTMKSKTPEFANKFEQFKTLADKFDIKEYSLTNPEEFFASTYAYFHLNDDNDANHILELDKQMQKLKNSDDPQAKQCLELLQELKQDAQNIIDSTRKQPQNVRFETRVRDLIRNECQDIISEMDNTYCANQFIGQSTELELINSLSLKDDDFEEVIKYYKQRSKSDKEFDEIKLLFAKIVNKLQELRKKL